MTARDWRATIAACERLAADVRAPDGEREAARARAAALRERHEDTVPESAAPLGQPTQLGVKFSNGVFTIYVNGQPVSTTQGTTSTSTFRW
jgi:hypothetical protein